MPPPRGLSVERFKELVPLAIARVRGWTAKQRWTRAEPNVTMTDDGMAFMKLELLFDASHEDYIEIVACAAFSPRGVPYLGQVLQADVEGCDACKHSVFHKSYLQCAHPKYDQAGSNGMAMGERIQQWQDEMAELGAFADDGSLVEDRCANRRCPGWQEK